MFVPSLTPGPLRRPARNLVHATVTFVGVSLALASRMKTQG